MIITFGGIKGGSGKTTLSTNTVSILSKQHNVLLVDADEQQTSSDWSAQRENNNIATPWTTVCLSGSSVKTQILKLKDKFDYVIVDTGGRETSSQRAAILVSDLFITPFQPRSFDIWTLSKINTLIDSAKVYNDSLKAFAVINRADCTGVDNEETKEIINNSSFISCLDCQITQRKAFCNAAAEGLSVDELKKKDPKAIKEILEFIQCLNDLMETPS